MATLAQPYPYPDAVGARSERLLNWVTTTDHKRIGILYLLTTALFFLLPTAPVVKAILTFGCLAECPRTISQ